MKDLILLCSTLAVFLFGFYIARRVDHFLAETQRRMDQGALCRCCLIRIAAESPVLLDAVSGAMNCCANSESCVEFAVSSGQAGRLLQQLRDGSVDLVLLREDTAVRSRSLSRLVIPAGGAESPQGRIAPVQTAAPDCGICVLWNPAFPSRMRDRMLLALREGRQRSAAR